MSQSQKLIAICPECNHEKIYNGKALRPRITCSECKTRFYIETPKTQKHAELGESTSNQCEVVKASLRTPSIPPPNTTQEAPRFIDDPDELLMSVAVRELNKPNPDPRWANVLITTRKENIGLSKKEGYIQSKFKSLSIKEVAKISSMKPTDISQKKDLKECS